LSSDFIVGFPGETEEDVAATLRLVDDVGFASAYSFKYSPRPGTPAAERSDQVPESVKVERLAALQARLEAQRRSFNAGTLGRTLDVLIERAGRHAGQLAGRTPYMQAVQIEDDAAIGDIVPVVIADMGPNSLFGRRANGRHGADAA
jgi:tRNA-2-methylthio-N6-dimethylallyladenosine synthase